ncbi:MAG: DUF3105 domain-containing protein [Chloroflexota bacterium]
MATKAKGARETPMSARQRRQQVREEAARERRNQNLFLLAAAGVLVLIVAYFLYLSFRGPVPVAGEEVFESQGNSHLANFGDRSNLEYNSTPPSSGPHYGNLAAWQVYEDPIRYEQLVHNLEDGGVVVYYQCEEACPELFEQLSASVQPYIDSGRHVILAPNDPTWTPGGGQPWHKDMGAPIALTAWGRVLKLDEYDADRIRSFIQRYEGIDHHQRGI